jgi:hypothetical protein
MKLLSYNQEGRSKYCRSHSVTSPTSTSIPSEDVAPEGESGTSLSSRPESGQPSHPLKNTVELKIVNEVGSQCSPNLEAARASIVRPLTPPSLDIVEEELAQLDGVSGETDVDAVLGESSQKLLPSGNRDVLDFDDDVDVDDLVILFDCRNLIQYLYYKEEFKDPEVKKLFQCLKMIIKG